MKKRIASLLTLVLLLSGCVGVTTVPAMPSPSAAHTQPPFPSASISLDLAALLPEDAGFQWRYYGFAEYAMNMNLTSIVRSAAGISYAAAGSVTDMSGGAASGDFSVKIGYTVTPTALRQKLQGEKALDNVLPELDLIRTPLQKGASWSQNVHDGKNHATVLLCTITDVKNVAGRNVYSVTYKDTGSDYVETRDITQGLGVTAFNRLYKVDSDSEMIGYKYNQPQGSPAAFDYKPWLPKLGKQYTYFGLAEYGHKGSLKLISGSDAEDLYEYDGVYADGKGTEEKFVIQYHVNLARGTVTEQVLSNERGDAEVNSKLHNLVILKFPLARNERWSQQATLNGKKVAVQAIVTDYDEIHGIVKVKYTAKGVPGYYENTYLETRTFEKGWGMTSFSNLLPGSIGISQSQAKNAARLAEAINQHMFGYSINKLN